MADENEQEDLFPVENQEGVNQLLEPTSINCKAQLLSFYLSPVYIWIYPFLLLFSTTCIILTLIFFDGPTKIWLIVIQLVIVAINVLDMSFRVTLYETLFSFLNISDFSTLTFTIFLVLSFLKLQKTTSDLCQIGAMALIILRNILCMIRMILLRKNKKNESTIIYLNDMSEVEEEVNPISENRSGIVMLNGLYTGINNIED